jgi:signal transduction histidine kinase
MTSRPATAPEAIGPGRSGLERILVRLVIGSRVSSTVVGGVAALIGLAPPARPIVVGAAVAGLVLWSGLFAAVVSARGPLRSLIVMDVLVVVALCLSRNHLLPASALQASAGTGWVDVVAGAGVCAAQWGLRQPAGLLAGAAIAAAWATSTPGAWEAPVVLIVTALLAAGMTFLLRRAAATQDGLHAEEAASRRQIAVQAAARADERDQQRRLHDTVLSTLTMVSTGSIGPDSQSLSRRAEDDLAVIEALRAVPPAHDRPRSGCTERLDRRLRAMLNRTGRQTAAPVAVIADLAAIEVPIDVAAAITDSALEALSNVARHARAGQAEVGAGWVRNQVRVTIRDEGVGFDPESVPGYRRGLRESIHGRMHAVGGDARTSSRPGQGTTIELWWPVD